MSIAHLVLLLQAALMACSSSAFVTSPLHASAPRFNINSRRSSTGVQRLNMQVTGLKRVVVTGMGVCSCLGQSKEAVADSLRNTKSGIRYKEAYSEVGMRSHVAGWPDVDFKELIPRKLLRFMSIAACYSYLAMKDCIEDSGLTPEMVSNPRTGAVVGSGGVSPTDIVETGNAMSGGRGLRKVGPYRVTKTMGSGVSANLATAFKIKGCSFSITSACSTSAHCIGTAFEQIQLGKLDACFAGGGEEEDYVVSSMFDAMGALSTKYNDSPGEASRAYDKDRDGFVIAAGGGVLVLEELEHAKARGATIYAELVGYAANSDGYDMVAPSGEGGERCMQLAIDMANQRAERNIDYINTHGTSTPVGDVAELGAIKNLFDRLGYSPMISSTKSLSGHSLGAAGVQEAIYSLLMMENKFVAGSANVFDIVDEAEGMDIVTKTRDVEVTRAMSNSFGFGGTNACLIFDKYSE